MGARGPAPKPTELRVVEGGIGKGGRDLSHKRPKEHPKFAPLTEHPPDWLPREAKAEWRRLVTEFDRVPGLLQRPDRAGLIAWCQEWARYVDASKDINGRGAIVDGMSRGVPCRVKNPNVQVAQAALEKLISLASRYGLTPGDRARLNIGKGTEGGTSQISGLLTGGGAKSG